MSSDRFLVPSLPSDDDLILEEQTRMGEEKKAKLEADIDSEHQRLVDWIAHAKNKKALHYGLVDDIYQHYIHDCGVANQSLEDRLADLRAVNSAIYLNYVGALSERAEANLTSNSVAMQVAGALLGTLAAALVVFGACTLNPIVFFVGALAALVAYGLYSAGATKVSTDKSSLFYQLKDKISPPQPDSVFTALRDQHVSSKYSLRML